MIIRVGFIIIHPAFDVLLIDLLGSKEPPADLFGHFQAEGFAAINIDRDVIFRGKGVNHHGTFDKGSPAGKTGLVRKPRRIASEDAGWGLFLHAEVADNLVEELITQIQIIAHARLAIVQIQQQLITENLIFFCGGFNRNPPSRK